MSPVSVVVPFYNRSRFLSRLLNSLLSQSLAPQAVYIVDNGSNEAEIYASLDIICNTKYTTLNIVYVSTIDKGNANYARNLGYILSDTKYVAFLDSDDWWESNHLKDSIEFLVNSDKSAVYSGAIIHTKNSHYINHSIDVNYFDNPFGLILSNLGYLATAPSFVVDKSLVSNCVFWDVNLKRHQDFDYFASIFYNGGGWCYCPRANVNVDWDEGGMNKKEVDFNSLILFFKKWEEKIPVEIKKNYLLNMLRFSYKVSADKSVLNFYREKYLSLNTTKNNYTIFISSAPLLCLYKFTVALLDFLKVKKILLSSYQYIIRFKMKSKKV